MVVRTVLNLDSSVYRAKAAGRIGMQAHAGMERVTSFRDFEILFTRQLDANGTACKRASRPAIVSNSQILDLAPNPPPTPTSWQIT